MKIRNAYPADLPAIDAIYNEAIDEGFKTAHTEPMSEEERNAWFGKFSEKFPVYVCEDNGEILGWLSVSPYRPGRRALSQTAEVSFYVTADARGKGVGSALLKWAVNRGKTLNLHVFIAILIESNQASISLLKKHGFEKWGYLPEVICFKGERRGQNYYGKIL